MELSPTAVKFQIGISSLVSSCGAKCRIFSHRFLPFNPQGLLTIPETTAKFGRFFLSEGLLSSKVHCGFFIHKSFAA